MPPHRSAYRILPVAGSGMRLGVFGGSFNPPHRGHLHVSLESYRRLGLNQVVWLVTPQNPLKEASGSGDNFTARLELARRFVADYPMIRVVGVEDLFRSNYTYNTLRRLSKMHPHDQLFWLMGADNLWIFHKWRRWQDIRDTARIVVVDRSRLLVNWQQSRLGMSLVGVAPCVDGPPPAGRSSPATSAAELRVSLENGAKYQPKVEKNGAKLTQSTSSSPLLTASLFIIKARLEDVSSTQLRMLTAGDTAAAAP